MAVPYKCPVCNGTGQVPAGFYDTETSINPQAEKCRSCEGTGIVWDKMQLSPWALQAPPYYTPPYTPNRGETGDPLPPWGTTTCRSDQTPG